MCTAVTVGNHINLSFTSAPAAGDQEVAVTLGATVLTANDYWGGFLNVQDGTGEGILYPVGAHPAADASASVTIPLAEGEQIQVAGATAETNVNLEKSLYKDVVISTTDQADVPVGVFNVTVAANAYGMIQTWGPAAVLQDEANAIGDMVTIGSHVAGAVEADDAAGEPLVGIQGPNTGVDTEYTTVYLRLEP
jgi:hypothetical protein